MNLSARPPAYGLRLSLFLTVALAASAAFAGEAFTVKWDAVLPSGAQWVAVTHVATSRTFRLKAALCVRKEWAKAADPATARLAWLKATAQAYLDRALHDESAEGIREAAIRAIKDAARQALEARAVCEALKLKYPGHAARIPTITVSLGNE